MMSGCEIVLPEELAKHVTIWNRLECRKIAGNAAPLRRNLERYLKRHPECEVYEGQDKMAGAPTDGIDPKTGARIVTQNEHVPIWHKIERRKVTGNAAPLRKNLTTYLSRHPECEEYTGQDKEIANCAVNALGEQRMDQMIQTSHAKPPRPHQVEANDTMRSWPSMRQHSSSIPIPMTLTDESVQNLGMSTTPQDLAAILNSPLAHSIDHEAHLLSESMDFSPSNYLFLNSPSRPQPHL